MFIGIIVESAHFFLHEIKKLNVYLFLFKLDGKQFKFDGDKQNTRPGKLFLKFHNRIFHKKRDNRIFHKKREVNRLRAQPEAEEMTEWVSAQEKN